MLSWKNKSTCLVNKIFKKKNKNIFKRKNYRFEDNTFTSFSKAPLSVMFGLWQVLETWFKKLGTPLVSLQKSAKNNHWRTPVSHRASNKFLVRPRSKKLSFLTSSLWNVKVSRSCHKHVWSSIGRRKSQRERRGYFPEVVDLQGHILRVIAVLITVQVSGAIRLHTEHVPNVRGIVESAWRRAPDGRNRWRTLAQRQRGATCASKQTWTLTS